MVRNTKTYYPARRNNHRWIIAIPAIAVAVLMACSPGKEVTTAEKGQQVISTVSPQKPLLTENPLKNAYFGDLHLHTSNSYDAAWAGVRTTPADAYRYAQGYPVTYFGAQVKRRAPLDFLAVTDHAEYMGVALQLLTEDGPFADTDWPAQMLNDDGSVGPGFLKILRSAFYGGEEYKEHKELNTKPIRQLNWQEVIDVADKFYQPGKFTTFAAFEWSHTPDGAHFHRNVIFRGPEYPEVPFSALEGRNPEQLWQYADANRARGIDSILIPHNPNLSGGRHFSYNDADGNPIDKAFAEAKARNEILVEITQIKGTSETHPELSPNDEFAGFEILEHYEKDERQSPHGSYAREGLARGMEIAEKVGINPYQFGFVGSSDYHSSTSATEEYNFTGALGDNDLPLGKENAKVVLETFNQVVRAPLAALSASGLAGVWAEQNTREAIFAAMKRRETFATSGPRIQVRMFAGWDYDEELVYRGDWLQQAYTHGVPMGGDLIKSDKKNSPRFLLHALKDPDSANLDRIQVVKVWYKDGESHEKVFDAVWSGDRQPDPKSGKVPAIENTVDVNTATYKNTVGAAQLVGEWVDPEFDHRVDAVYYARVIEIPTPRWSTYLAVRNDLPILDSVPPTLQERAWTSPIFYTP